MRICVCDDDDEFMFIHLNNDGVKNQVKLLEISEVCILFLT